MITYFKEEDRIIVKAVFTIENVKDYKNLNEIIADGLMKLSEQIRENKIRIYDIKELGLY